MVSFLLHILHTAVCIELAACAFPIQITLDEIDDDADDGINWAN